MGKSNKLTPEQNQFACQHLSLVKVFLFKNHLDQEFYDVVIFGYLDAVREYLENPELSRFRCMEKNEILYDKRIFVSGMS